MSAPPDLPPRRLFMVMGTQRTGTTLLREILNSSDQLMMMAEVLLPYPDSCHWDQFASTLPAETLHPQDEVGGMALLDRYFDYLHREMTRRWKEPPAVAYGVDIKLDQLRLIQPADWPADATPFILHYAMRRGVILINTLRRNVIHCAISFLIGTRRAFWHNYENREFEHPYAIGVGECLYLAREMVKQQREFEVATQGYRLVRCEYEDLAHAVSQAPDGDLSRQPGPFADIAAGFGIDCAFRFNGRLQRAINRPYQEIISNYSALIEGLRSSEFERWVEDIR